MWFEAISALKINLRKSEILPVDEVPNAEELAQLLGSKQSSPLTTYLVLLLGEKYKSKSIWEGMEEKMKRKLAMWKRNYISKGGHA